MDSGPSRFPPDHCPACPPRQTGCYGTGARSGGRHPELSARGGGYARLRGDGCGPHPRRIPDRNPGGRAGAAAAPFRSGRRGVLRAVRVPAVARPRRSRPRDAAPAGHRALPAVAPGPHHAGLPGRGGDHLDPAPGGQPRQQHGLAGQPHADPGVCAADADRRADPDVEPVGRGELLPGAAGAGLPGLPVAGAGPGSGDRGGGGGQPGLGSAAHPDRRGGQLPQLAAGLRVLVRRRDAAGGVDRQPGRLAAPAGPQPVGDLRDRTGGLPDFGLPAGRAQEPGSGHPGAVRGAHLDGRHRRLRTAGPAGPGPPRPAAPDHG